MLGRGGDPGVETLVDQSPATKTSNWGIIVHYNGLLLTPAVYKLMEHGSISEWGSLKW